MSRDDSSNILVMVISGLVDRVLGEPCSWLSPSCCTNNLATQRRNLKVGSRHLKRSIVASEAARIPLTHSILSYAPAPVLWVVLSSLTLKLATGPQGPQATVRRLKNEEYSDQIIIVVFVYKNY